MREKLHRAVRRGNPVAMGDEPTGCVAVIFVSARNDADETGYAAASAAMDRLAAEQPGFRGATSVRDAAGLGITVSYWADEASAIAWRDQPDHRAIREAGRNRWYQWYRVEVTTVTRSYAWRRDGT